MPRIAYVNGRYLPFAEAGVHVEDRGLQFADAVYEVIAVIDGQLTDETAHLDRLDRSMREIRLVNPPLRAHLRVAMRQTIKRNRVSYGMLYMQVGRGVAPRDHGLPADATPSVVMTCRPFSIPALVKRLTEGVGIATMPDDRWARPDIKATSLLPNVLAKQAARDEGAFEAWLVDEKGFITEGSSTNAWIVTDAGTLVTRPLSTAILAGITRDLVMAQALEQGLMVEERAFTVDEAKAAREAFLTSTTGGPVPVVRIDDRPISNGAPGTLTDGLIATYRRHLASFARDPAAAFKKLSGI